MGDTLPTVKNIENRLNVHREQFERCNFKRVSLHLENVGGLYRVIVIDQWYDFSYITIHGSLEYVWREVRSATLHDILTKHIHELIIIKLVSVTEKTLVEVVLPEHIHLLMKPYAGVDGLLVRYNVWWGTETHVTYNTLYEVKHELANWYFNRMTEYYNVTK